MFKKLAFFKEAYGELKKVVWPSREATIRYTLMVIVLSVFVALVLGAADLGLLKLVSRFFVKQ
jgi:preprotein translocase subunit SecE